MPLLCNFVYLVDWALSCVLCRDGFGVGLTGRVMQIFQTGRVMQIFQSAWWAWQFLLHFLVSDSSPSSPQVMYGTTLFYGTVAASESSDP